MEICISLFNIRYHRVHKKSSPYGCKQEEGLLVNIFFHHRHSVIRYATRERVAEWLRGLTRKPKVRTAVGSNPTLDSLVAVRNTSPGRPEPCEGNLVAVAGSCGGLMVKHPWPLLEISLSDFRGLATLNINTYLPTYTWSTIATENGKK